MDKLLIYIYYTNIDLYNKQYHHLSGNNIEIKKFTGTLWDYYMSIFKLDYKWIICIDETFLINDISRIFSQIDMMEKNKITISGIPDGGIYSIRCGSPYVFNNSFIIFDMEHLVYNIDKIEKFKLEWHNSTDDYRKSQCCSVGVKHDITYGCNFDYDIVYQDYYPIMISLMINNSIYHLKARNNLDHPYKSCPPVKVYNNIDELIGLYCKFGEYYHQNNIKLDLGINKIISTNNKERIDYFIEKIFIDKLINISIEINCQKYYYHNYADLYSEHFKKINKKPQILSIGIYENNSHIRVLKKYFDIDKITSIDKHKYNMEHIDNSVFCDTTNSYMINKFINGKQWDIIIDNGLYRPWEQIYTMSYIFKNLKPGGLYILENTHLPNLINKWGGYNEIDNKTNDIIINEMINLNIKPFYIRENDYIYTKDHVSCIYKLDNVKKCIKCIKCNNMDNMCKCEYKNEKMVTIIQKK